MTEKVCLIDGSGYIFRAFFASPMMTNPQGLPVNAVYGFLNMFLSLTQNISCDYCLVLFDAKRQNYRNEIFPEYKATRPELPPELKPQFDLIHEVVEALNLHWLQMEGYEADDLIATYTDIALKAGKEVTIVSADKDLMQLIRDGVTFYDSMKNKFFTPEDVKEKFGVYPERVTDVQALAGDSTDNIPGVPGIGIKTAAELVNQFGSLEQVLVHAEEIKQNKRRELILAHQQDALISQKLVTLKADVPVEIGLKDLRCLAPNQDVLINLIDRHAFKSLKNKALNWLSKKCADLPAEEKKYTPTYRLIKNIDELRQLYKEIKAANTFTFLTYKQNNTFLGLSVALKDARAFYLPLGQTLPAQDLFSAPTTAEGLTAKELKEFLEPLFSDPAVMKISINLKESCHDLAQFLNINIFPFPYDDIAVLSYDLYSSVQLPILPALTTSILELPLKSADPEYKKADFTTMPLSEVLSFFAEEADYSMRMYNILKPKLLAEKKLFVYDGIDRPLIQTLYTMEQAGVMLDTLKLKELDTLFDTEMNKISAEIYELAGETFNIGSPKQ
ncbi:MAG: DNA polymerase I, partial [Alphaproteobacteria bacterium]|nr:DNA polymerase I [Alphaproteobacteria bacterium]